MYVCMYVHKKTWIVLEGDSTAMQEIITKQTRKFEAVNLH
jgi:hypothetical protein